MDEIRSLMLQQGWRKGPWTALEDRLLTEYVQQHGEGSWNSVAKLTGIVDRADRSCSECFSSELFVQNQDQNSVMCRAEAQREELPAAVGELPQAGPEAGEDHPRRGDRHPPAARHARQQVWSCVVHELEPLHTVACTVLLCWVRWCLINRGGGGAYACRWSAIARCLPGRTDNEIKNYWRTHFKKARPSRRARAQLLHQYQLQQQQQHRQYLHSLNLLQQQQQQLQQQQQQQQQQMMLLQEQEQQSPQEEAADDSMVMMMMMNDLQSKERCCTAVSVVPDDCVLPADDDAIWDSLWRLVDGDGSCGEGSSGGEYWATS